MDATARDALAPAVVLFGSPGSGKGTQAKLLRSCLKAPHISTGDMLRTHIQAKDEIGEQNKNIIKSGRLVSDEVVNGLVEARIAEPDCQGGMILDGFPRTLKQARFLVTLTERYRFAPAVIHLMVDCDKIVARLSGRRQCPVCGTLYSLRTNPPKVSGVCDLDGAALITREDDRESVIRQRLAEYESQTRPLLNFFRDSGVPMFEIDGAGGAPEEISRQICNSLVSAGLAPNTAAAVTP